MRSKPSWALYEVDDLQNSRYTYYGYDGIGRAISERVYEKDTSTNTYTLISSDYSDFNEYSKSSGEEIYTEDFNFKSNYTYRSDGSLTQIYNTYMADSSTNEDAVKYTYDTINRLKQKILEHHNNTNYAINTYYEYRNHLLNDSYSSNLTSSIEYKKGNAQKKTGNYLIEWESTFYDDPRDQSMIELGYYRLWERF